MENKYSILTKNVIEKEINTTNSTKIVNLSSESKKIEILIKGVTDKYSVITSGWHTWSGKLLRSKDVGMGSFKEKFSKNKTEFFVEPGLPGETIPEGRGVSYSYIVLRSKDGLENMIVGIVPSMKSIERITFYFNNDGLILSLEKIMGDVDDKDFRVVFSKGSYTKIITEYNQELLKINKVKLMKNRLIWFSWSAYGKAVTQTDILSELPYFSDIGIDSLIIDDGWETIVGQWEVDTNKFPDMIGLVSSIKKLNIKPGIWIAPFMTMKESDSSHIKDDWIMRGLNGDAIEVTNYQLQPTNRPLPIMEKSIGLDISIQEVRNYIHSEIIRFHRIGFEIFKLDYLSIPFMGKLKNKDRSVVEYYRLFFDELREKLLKEKNGRSVELIGCGGPLFESIGLFEGIRITDDSAMPIIDGFQFYRSLINIILKIPFIGKSIKKQFSTLQTLKYSDAASVAFKRAMVLKDVHGSLVDGVHLTDPEIDIDEKEKVNLSEALLAFKGMGLLTNIFIGDSFRRSGIVGRVKWKDFINQFSIGKDAWIDDRTGNVLVND